MTEETMKKELNVTEVLDRVKDLDNYNKETYSLDADIHCIM